MPNHPLHPVCTLRQTNPKLSPEKLWSLAAQDYLQKHKPSTFLTIIGLQGNQPTYHQIASHYAGLSSAEEIKEEKEPQDYLNFLNKFLEGKTVSAKDPFMQYLKTFLMLHPAFRRQVSKNILKTIDETNKGLIELKPDKTDGEVLSATMVAAARYTHYLAPKDKIRVIEHFLKIIDKPQKKGDSQYLPQEFSALSLMMDLYPELSDKERQILINHHNGRTMRLDQKWMGIISPTLSLAEKKEWLQNLHVSCLTYLNSEENKDNYDFIRRYCAYLSKLFAYSSMEEQAELIADLILLMRKQESSTLSLAYGGLITNNHREMVKGDDLQFISNYLADYYINHTSLLEYSSRFVNQIYDQLDSNKQKAVQKVFFKKMPKLSKEKEEKQRGYSEQFFTALTASSASSEFDRPLPYALIKHSYLTLENDEKKYLLMHVFKTKYYDRDYIQEFMLVDDSEANAKLAAELRKDYLELVLEYWSYRAEPQATYSVSPEIYLSPFLDCYEKLNVAQKAELFNGLLQKVANPSPNNHWAYPRILCTLYPMLSTEEQEQVGQLFLTKKGLEERVDMGDVSFSLFYLSQSQQRQKKMVEQSLEWLEKSCNRSSSANLARFLTEAKLTEAELERSDKIWHKIITTKAVDEDNYCEYLLLLVEKLEAADIKKESELKLLEQAFINLKQLTMLPLGKVMMIIQNRYRALTEAELACCLEILRPAIKVHLTTDENLRLPYCIKSARGNALVAILKIYFEELSANIDLKTNWMQYIWICTDFLDPMLAELKPEQDELFFNGYFLNVLKEHESKPEYSLLGRMINLLYKMRAERVERKQELMAAMPKDFSDDLGSIVMSYM